MTLKNKLSDSDSADSFVESEYLMIYPDVATAVSKGTFSSGYEHYEKYGRSEGRKPNGRSPREHAVFSLIDKQGLGLEIGPSHNPLAPKKRGYNVHILDHASAHELREKYKGSDLNLDNIEEVDFVWHGQPLTELIGNMHCYDWIIASHVIEHVPDLITFLQQCEQLLKPNGVLSLVIPDKRYCFDYFQPLSSTGMLLDAYAEKRIKPTPGQVFDHFANASTLNDSIAWSANSTEIPNKLIYSVRQADEQWRIANSADDYIDVHCWRFTPDSFSLMLSDINRMRLINIKPLLTFPTIGCEFYTTLGFEGASEVKDKSRITYLKNIK